MVITPTHFPQLFQQLSIRLKFGVAFLCTPVKHFNCNSCQLGLVFEEGGCWGIIPNGECFGYPLKIQTLPRLWLAMANTTKLAPTPSGWTRSPL